MRRTRRGMCVVLLAAGTLLPSANCLPEDYVLTAGRNTAVTIADTIVAQLIQPVLDSITGTTAP